MYQEKIVDAITGEITFRAYTETEIAEVEAAKLEAEKKAENQKIKELARAALLAKLGITEEEAKLLLS